MVLSTNFFASFSRPRRPATNTRCTRIASIAPPNSSARIPTVTRANRLIQNVFTVPWITLRERCHVPHFYRERQWLFSDDLSTYWDIRNITVPNLIALLLVLSDHVRIFDIYSRVLLFIYKTIVFLAMFGIKKVFVLVFYDVFSFLHLKLS